MLGTGVGDRNHPLSDLQERASAGRHRRAGRDLGDRAAGGRASLAAFFCLASTQIIFWLFDLADERRQQQLDCDAGEIF